MPDWYVLYCCFCTVSIQTPAFANVAKYTCLLVVFSMTEETYHWPHAIQTIPFGNSEVFIVCACNRLSVLMNISFDDSSFIYALLYVHPQPSRGLCITDFLGSYVIYIHGSSATTGRAETNHIHYTNSSNVNKIRNTRK